MKHDRLVIFIFRSISTLITLTYRGYDECYTSLKIFSYAMTISQVFRLGRWRAPFVFSPFWL
jgi:hypothetical protein